MAAAISTTVNGLSFRMNRIAANVSRNISSKFLMFFLPKLMVPLAAKATTTILKALKAVAVSGMDLR